MLSAGNAARNSRRGFEMTWERFWILCSAAFLIVAAIFLWRNNLSAAFVIAALGACAWFLSYRTQLREQIPDDEESDDEPEVNTGSGSDRVEEVSTGSGSDRVDNPDEP